MGGGLRWSEKASLHSSQKDEMEPVQKKAYGEEGWKISAKILNQGGVVTCEKLKGRYS